MTRKEYEAKLKELDEKFYDDDTSYDEREEIARIAEELHERYSHYDKEMLKETLELKEWHNMHSYKRRNRRKLTLRSDLNEIK